MTKRELVEMLSGVPDDAIISITREGRDLFLSPTTSAVEINGYYEFGEMYILTSLNVMPRKND